MAMTYDEAARRLGRRASVQIDKRRGTEFRRAPGEAGMRGDIQVTYRGTPVVTFHPDHTYTLRTGGMASKVIIKRIAEYSPISLTRRGNGFFLEDVGTGKLMPFLEGAKVDQQGRILDDEGGLITDAESRQSAPPLVRGTGKAGSSTKASVVDEARLRAFIKRTVLEIMSETVMPPNAPMRPVTMRARVTPQESVSLDMVEKLLTSAGVDKEWTKRTMRDLRAAHNRGRDKADDYESEVAASPDTEITEAADEEYSGNGPLCPDCKEPIALHYDRANRLRGCDYAMDHRGEKVELIR